MTGVPSAPDTAWFANFGQISIVVPDLAAAVRFWRHRMRVGPWHTFQGVPFNGTYDGAPVSVSIDVALAWHDGRLLELLEPRGKGPSPFHDAMLRPVLGLQRLASISADIDRDAAAARARGLEQFGEVALDGQRFLYFRDPAIPGVVLELLEKTPALADLLARLQAGARAWANHLKSASEPTDKDCP